MAPPFWEAVVAEYRPHIDDSELLLEVCRTLDLVEALQGQLGEKGVVTEIRLQRQLLARLLTQLGLEHDDGQTMPSPATERAKKAAATRWLGMRSGAGDEAPQTAGDACTGSGGGLSALPPRRPPREDRRECSGGGVGRVAPGRV